MNNYKSQVSRLRAFRKEEPEKQEESDNSSCSSDESNYEWIEDEDERQLMDDLTFSINHVKVWSGTVYDMIDMINDNIRQFKEKKNQEIYDEPVSLEKSIVLHDNNSKSEVAFDMPTWIALWIFITIINYSIKLLWDQIF